MSARKSDLYNFLPMDINYLLRVYELELESYDFPWTKEILRDCILYKYDSFVVVLNDNLVGYRLRPNQSLVRRKGANITTDSEGFRIDNKKIVKEDTKFIVFVGDSVTYGGSYIDNENLFSSKYCNLIYDKNISCLNSGINAWGLHNMSRLISNYNLYSSRKPIKFILVILPGDEGRNFKAFSDTPFWSNKPKQPSALNEIIKFI